MTRPLTEEEQRYPGTALAKLLGTAVRRTLTGEEVVLALELLGAVRLEAIEEAYRSVGKVIDRVLVEKAA